MKTLGDVAAHIEKQRKLMDVLFEAISVIAVGVGVINPKEIALEALQEFYRVGKK